MRACPRFESGGSEGRELQRRACRALTGDRHPDPRRAELLEPPPHGALGKIGAVAVLAQVREEDVGEAVGHDPFERVRGLLVAQVPVAA